MWSDNEVRYNISINDGSKNSHAGIFVWCDEAYRSEPLRNTRVYGNKIISFHGGAVHFETGYSQGLRFDGNQFCLTGGNKNFITGDNTKYDARFQGNNYWVEGSTVQPKEPQDSTATYQLIEWEKPEKIKIKELKSLIEKMLTGL